LPWRASSGAISARWDVLVYLRFLHAIPEAAEDTLLGVLTERLPMGFHLCAEFRTEHDADRPKAEAAHYRRYINEVQLAEKLTTIYGFEVEHLEAGAGLSPFKGEDPHLARIIARAPVHG
jgi:hypothetical protein